MGVSLTRSSSRLLRNMQVSWSSPKRLEPSRGVGGRPLGGGGRRGAGGGCALARRRRRHQPAPTSNILPCHPAAELPLPSGARAHFLLKRRSRLCVTEPEAVDGAGGVEWNTSCVQVCGLLLRQTAHLHVTLHCMPVSCLPPCRAACCAANRTISPRLCRPPRPSFQTATLFKDGDAWRPKEFVFKVQRVLGGCWLT